MSATNSQISTRKVCPSVKNSINIQQIIILLVSIYQISRKIQPCFPMDKQKKGKKKKFQLAEISIPSVISSRLIEPERGNQNTMEWNKGSHGREIVPFSRLNFIMRGEIESRRSITRGSREIPRRFSRPTPLPSSSQEQFSQPISVLRFRRKSCLRRMRFHLHPRGYKIAARPLVQACNDISPRSSFRKRLGSVRMLGEFPVNE